eukprot:TRINITY_DN4087_c0_g1_i1.p1 TRINITY_DN4087_c0_g1~~TRINITY_DN4087_c0_g1_i1.p1  ORF type:complete len:462 (-),score=88.59 TRINITY_DN4087_c0_g1_i1:468-1853(-)
MASHRFMAHMPSCVPKNKVLKDFIVDSASRCTVRTTCGRSFLDFAAGIGALSTGHCHPKVAIAAAKQAATAVHCQQNFFGTHTAQADLLDRLVPKLPRAVDSIFFTNCGSEATDNAIKLARVATGRDAIIAFQGGFHGRTLGALSVTTSRSVFKRKMGSSVPRGNTFIAPFPHCSHCPTGAPEGAACCGRPVQQLEEEIFGHHIDADEVAAFLIEPVQGEGGIIAPPDGYLRELRRLADKHGILLIYDEVQSGVGRTGKFWSYQHWDNPQMDGTSSSSGEASSIAPDVLTFAKGIASGYPLAGVAASAHLFGTMPYGALGGTYGGNAVASAAAAATLDVIDDEGLVENAAVRGAQMKAALKDLAQQRPGIVREVRGKGLMLGMEFDATVVPKGFAGDLVTACAERGLIIMTAGSSETVRLLPPLILNDREMSEGLEIFSAAVRHMTDSIPAETRRSPKTVV